MAEATERYIIRKGRTWLQSNRADRRCSPSSYLFSVYLYDAKEYDTEKDAKREAKKMGGDVWVFTRATGYSARVWLNPRTHECGNCKRYAGYDGECKKPGSEYYRFPVSIRGTCDKWEDRRK